MVEVFKRLVKEEEGQGMVEYGLIIALIALIAMVALKPIGEQVKTVFNKIENGLKGTMPTE